MAPKVGGGYLRAMFVDTHTHLYHHRFDDDREAMVRRAIDSGVKRLYLPNIDESSIDGMHEMVRDWPGVCFPMMGLHPCSVTTDSDDLLQRMKGLLLSGDYVAVGEIGIDLYWDKSTLPEQQKAFREQVRWAKELGLPIVIHCRDSFNEVFEIVSEENGDDLTGVFHCFTGSGSEAQKVKSLGGFFMGIGGVATFKNGGLAETLPEIGLEHMVLETDSPYLAPVPYRGKRNESSYVALVAEKISSVLNIKLEEVARITTHNANILFSYDG